MEKKITRDSDSLEKTFATLKTGTLPMLYIHLLNVSLCFDVHFLRHH